MPQGLHIQPILYSYRLEKSEPDEAETAKKLMETMRSISEKTYADTEHGFRSVHAKNDGVLKGEIQIYEDLPVGLAQGAFAVPGTYDVVIRLSTAPGDVLPDFISTSRGFGLKIKGVHGDTLPGTEGPEQNFVMVNGPAFLTPNAKQFLLNLKPLAALTDKVEGFKVALSAALQKVEAGIEKLGTQSAKVMNMGGHPETHILGETFFSEVPFLYGAYVAKFSVAPVSPDLKALHGLKLDMKDKPNALRDAVREYFSSHDAEWELRVQLCADLEKMPIEDASVEWPEELSPFIAVGRITVPKGGMISDEDAFAEESQLAFNPWHGLQAHRPLGSINRARKPSYDMSAAFRRERSGCPMHGAMKIR